MRQILMLTAVFSLPLTVIADEYSFEVDALGSQNKVPNFTDGDRADLDIYQVGVTYYFNLVDDTVGPYSEAAFLNKASSLSWFGATTETESSDGETDSIGLGARAVVSEKFIFELAYLQSEQDQGKGALNSDIKAYGLGLGMYTTDNSALTLSYAVYDDETQDHETFLSALEFEGVVEADGNDYMSGGVVLDYAETEGANDIFSANADINYHFNQQFRVGASIGMEDITGNGLSSNTYGISTQYFVTSKVAVGVDYVRQAYQNSEDEDDVSVDDFESLSLNIIGRF